VGCLSSALGGGLKGGQRMCAHPSDGAHAGTAHLPSSESKPGMINLTLLLT